LIPPRGFNSVRYHGVFSPGSKLRSKVIPTPHTPEASQSEELEPQPAPSIPARRPSRIPWAQLLQRVFRADVETCVECGGRMKLRAFVTDAQEARRYLEHMGLPAEVPSIAMARAPPQVEMVFDEG